MPGRKRWRSPREKRALRVKLIVYACLLIIPTALGAAGGTIPYLLPTRHRFGESKQIDRSPAAALTITQRCLTGAAVGGLVGVGACAVFAGAGRLKKKR